MKNIPHVRNQTISRKLRIFFLYILGNSFFYAPIIVFPLGGGGGAGDPGDFDHTMKPQWGEFDLCINSQSREILTSAILKVCAVLTLKGLVTSMAEKQDQVSSKKVFYTQCLNFYQV